MSAPRLTFLYPFLFAPTRPATVREASRTARRAFGASSHRRQPPAARKRYGTANEPLPHLAGEGKKVQAKPQLTRDGEKPQITRDGEKPQVTRDGEKPSTLSRDVKEEDTKDDAPLNPSQGQQLHAQPEEAAKDRAQPTPAKEEGVIIISDSATTAKTKPSPPKQEEAEEDDEDDEPTVIEAMPPTGRLPPSPVMDAAESAPVEGPSPQPQVYAKPLETVLNMPPPDSSNPAATALYTTPDPPGNDQSQDKKTTDGQAADQPLEGQKPPHISTPPYVHHFDTYSLVRRLEEGGWTQEQAVTLMKAVRLILSGNMDLARNGLVSKSNVENESYLFSAACSELKTEIQTKRATEGERSRTDRTQLQHEVDILNQRMTQESATMKDELKGMFDDRKMFVRNDQRDMERKIQELNYRITVSLNSDSRSDVEGVRWIITKRAISALAICVAMILGSLKFASSVKEWEEEEKRALAAARKHHHDRENSPKASRGGNGGGNGGDNGSGGLGTDELRDILVQQGDNPAFVSLG